MHKVVKRVLFIIMALSALWASGFAWFYYSSPHFSTVKVDAIIALTGDNRRLRAAFECLEKGQAERLFISGVSTGVKIEEIWNQVYIATPTASLKPLPKELAQKTELGSRARNTYQNAYEAALWIKKQNLKTICLLTSDYHMQRSLLEFQYALPALTIIPCSLPSAGKQRLWLKEYHKFWIVWFRQVLGFTKENFNDFFPS